MNVDRRSKLKTFSKEDLVMIHLSKERYLSGAYNKLKAKSIGPFSIIQKINDTAYIIGFPDEWKISKTVNGKDIFKFFPPYAAKTLEQNSRESSSSEEGED